MMKTPLTQTLWISLALGILTLLILVIIPPSVWDAMSPASCLPDGCFCEAVTTANPIRQPSNTVSSLAFAVVGVWVLLQARETSRNSPFKTPHRVMFGISALMIGLGSAFYHASMTFVGQFFDIFGMYLLTGLMWVYALGRWNDWGIRTMAMAYLGLNVALTVLQIGLPETRRYAFAIILLLALLTEAIVWKKLHPARDYRWFWGGLGAFTLAYLIWNLDNSGAWCDPHAWLQGHALWHIFGAGAVFCLWRWYISEK
jgi:hypothetical protein